MAKMKTVKDFLTQEEASRYQEAWKSFRNKYRNHLNHNAISEHSTHSGKPVISQVFQFEDKPLFRAPVLNRRLRKVDPYFLAGKYIHPFWHISHYLMVLEQMYFASVQEIRDVEKLATKDVPQEFKLSKPIFWRDNVSVELILDPRKQTKKYTIEDCFFTLYADNADEVRSRISVRTFVTPRAYIVNLERLKQGDKTVLEELIKRIKGQAINHGRLLKPRQNIPKKEHLIERLKTDEIPEKELHDFFSLWD